MIILPLQNIIGKNYKGKIVTSHAKQLFLIQNFIGVSKMSMINSEMW